MKMSQTPTIPDAFQQPTSEPTIPREESPAAENKTIGTQVLHETKEVSQQTSWASQSSADLGLSTNGAQTPDLLFYQRDVLSRIPTAEQDISDEVQHLDQIQTHRSTPHIGDALENFARTLTNTGREHSDESYELQPTISRRARTSATFRKTSCSPILQTNDLAAEAGSPHHPTSQGVPPDFRNLAMEVIFVLICSSGQLLFAWFLGDINVNQSRFKDELGLQSTQLPWLVGAFNIANGLSVILSGSLTDLVPPKRLIVGAFLWLTIWNIIAVFALIPSRSILFFVFRAMQGLAVGVLASGSMSLLGRIYNPGLRKTRG